MLFKRLSDKNISVIHRIGAKRLVAKSPTDDDHSEEEFEWSGGDACALPLYSMSMRLAVFVGHIEMNS